MDSDTMRRSNTAKTILYFEIPISSAIVILKQVSGNRECDRFPFFVRIRQRAASLTIALSVTK